MHLAHNLNPAVIKELGLGSQVSMNTVPTIYLSPDGRHIDVSGETVSFADGTPHPEGAIFAQMRAQLKRFADLLAPLALRSPPDLSKGIGLSGLGELASLAKLGLNLRGLGASDMREFLRIVLSNTYDLILDDLADGPLAGGLAADSVWGAWAGPRSPGTIFSLMYRYGVGTSAQVPVGGMDRLIKALANCARGHGAEIRTQHKVHSVLVDNDRVSGVTFTDGTVFTAKTVLSSLAPLPTMHLVGVEHFDTEAVRRVRHVRAKGVNAKINLTIKGALDVPGLDQKQSTGRLVMAPSAIACEQAFNAAKFGKIPEVPVLEIYSPHTSDASTPPQDTQLLSVVAQYIPYHVDGGWTDQARRQLQERVIDTLSLYSPSLRSQIDHTETLSPEDIENETGAPGGHWHHCELNTDQLLTVRPVNGMAHYAFGVSGFYLCGASSHPGGDVTGLPGRNSAMRLIKEGLPS
ncbi:MAG: NAD(P)/FAD-dependent oxidoreductase [Pseudomonadota bacterium]